jgi:hypothetical protein
MDEMPSALAASCCSRLSAVIIDVIDADHGCATPFDKHVFWAQVEFNF